MARTLSAAAFASAALLLVVGCSNSGKQLPRALGGVAEPRCVAGMRWAGVHQGWGGGAPIPWDAVHQRSLDMHPGRNCLGCHALSGNPAVPDLIIAGTIYAAADEPSDCYGVRGVEVLITDATGTTYHTVSGASGNFRIERASVPNFSFPFRAAIRANGREVVMPDRQVVGACNFCHSATGRLGALGRIIAPAAGSDVGIPAPDSGLDAITPDGPRPDGPRRDVKPPPDGGPKRDSTVDGPADATPRDTTRDTLPRDTTHDTTCSAGGFGAPCTKASDCCTRLCSGPPFNKTCH